ncbi:hypothetical protein Tco_0601528 [Tanacetum coccineum]
MKGSCKSLVELEYLFEEVYKATTEQLDWNNLEDLEYLCGGVASQKYATLVMKTKAADYGHIKWIKDLVPNRMWSQVQVSYDKHALWGISHYGQKRQQFYRFSVSRESTQDVYSKQRIIAVTKLQIVEWHNYKHLDWITIRRDYEKLYKFKEGDLKRLRIQDIEDMLLLLAQGKLTNLTVEERLVFNIRRDQILNEEKLIQHAPILEMQYLLQTIWRQSDRDKAGAMIQAIDKQLKTRRIMRSLEKFVGGRPYEEHVEFDESDTYVLERFDTLAGNPVNEILLILNLLDHRIFKDGDEVKGFQGSFHHSDTERLSRSDEVLKLKNFKKDATLKLFKSTKQERASMQDLYDRMGRMEIRQDVIERMEYRQSYNWDRYQGVFEHMAEVYSVPLHGAYNPPGYAQPQYDHYY